MCLLVHSWDGVSHPVAVLLSAQLHLHLLSLHPLVLELLLRSLDLPVDLLQTLTILLPWGGIYKSEGVTRLYVKSYAL